MGVLLGVVGCEDYFEEPYDGPHVPDISGDWTGSFFYYEYSSSKIPVQPGKGSRRGETSITATITLNETDHSYVTITTSREGRGHRFTGRIDAAGNMNMTDSYDGETWTTHKSRATTERVELNDIAWEDELQEGLGKGLLTILLDEHLPKPRESNLSILTDI